MSTLAFIIGFFLGGAFGAVMAAVFILDLERPGRRKKPWEK